MSLLAHLGLGGIGGIVGIGGHLLTAGLSIWSKYINAGTLTEIQKAAVVKESYKHAPHIYRMVLTFVLLLMTYFASVTDSPKELVESLTLWTGVAMGWTFGALALLKV